MCCLGACPKGGELLSEQSLIDHFSVVNPSRRVNTLLKDIFALLEWAIDAPLMSRG